MSTRYHWWGFIVNEVGEPIENAEITVKLAGTDVLANLYYDEFGNTNSADAALIEGPQLTTLSNGYYEFWVGDVTEPFGYRNDQKFTLEWIRLGVAHGMIEYINVFPLGLQTDPAAILDCTSPSTVMNKLISNYLACKWDMHSDSTVIDGEGDFISVHGLDFVNVNELDTIKNKLVSNYYGWNWEKHRESTTQTPTPSAGNLPWDGRPHNLDEVNPLDGSDSLRNKLVSNIDIYDIHLGISTLRGYSDGRDDILQGQITQNLAQILTTLDTSRAGWWEIFPAMWNLYRYDTWTVSIAHDLDIYYPFVQIYDKDTGKVVPTTEIIFVDNNTIRIDIQNENTPADPIANYIVRIGTGGVHRSPEEI